MAYNMQEDGLSELIVSPGLKAYECMNKSREYLFSSSPSACKNMMQPEQREIRDGQWKWHRKMKGVQGAQGLNKPKSHRLRCWVLHV